MGKKQRASQDCSSKLNHNIESNTKLAAKKQKRDDNPLLTAQQTFLGSLSHHERNQFFSPTHLTPSKRAEIWEAQADLGETLVNSYAWATPDPRLLKVFQYFGPIVEMGCGANAYWSRWMNSEGRVDVVAFDANPNAGGKIGATNNSIEISKAEVNKEGLSIRKGGPEILSKDEEIRDSGRALFLCYPDEEVFDDDDDNEDSPMSMAEACLQHFTGSTVIHVGELYGDSLSIQQAPFGRSSSIEFQNRLASEYHCILKMRLENNWLHVRDSLSVWKRSETCCMVFEGDGDSNGDDEEVHYKNIPPDEVIPVDMAAPCVNHLLGCQSKLSKRDDGQASMERETSNNIMIKN